MNRQSIAFTMCLLMIASYAPASAADETTDPLTPAPDSTIWGVSYDWENFEDDMLKLTGVDVNEINRDLEEAASYAGFDLEYDQVISGTTQFFVETWDVEGPFDWNTSHGETHSLSKRITELTIRHGSMADTGMATNWFDGDEEIDAWLSAYQDYLMVLNANYVEYVDDDMLVYGGELLVDGEFSVSMGFDAELGVTAANETFSPDISANMELSFEIPHLEATWREPGYASSQEKGFDYHFVMGSEPSEDSGPRDGSDWHPYTYCSSEEFQTYQMCNQADFEEGDLKFIQDHSHGGAEMRGSFSSVTGYSLEMSATGFPTEEFDLDIDMFNVALSDSIPDQGTIDTEINVASYALWGHDCPPVSDTPIVTVDGNDYQAQCGVVLPVPWAMTDMLEQSLGMAFEGGVEQLGDSITTEMEDLLGELFQEDDEYDDEYGSFVCDNGNVIPDYWVNDGWDDCGDNSDEEMQPQVWSCAVDVRVDSLDDTGFDSFEAKTLDHPGFPEWCGTPVGDLQISETQPNLPPADDVYGALIDDPEWQYIGARNASHWYEFWTEDSQHDGQSPQDCEDMAGTWVDEYESCAFPAYPDTAIDGELIQGGDGQWTRYFWSGDYLYLAVPTSEDGIIWAGMGPRVTDFICDDWDPYLRVQEWQVGDGIEDCEDGSDEHDSESTESEGLDKFERMGQALDESDLESTMEEFGERLEWISDNIQADDCGMVWPEDPFKAAVYSFVAEYEISNDIYGPAVGCYTGFADWEGLEVALELEDNWLDFADFDYSGDALAYAQDWVDSNAADYGKETFDLASEFDTSGGGLGWADPGHSGVRSGINPEELCATMLWDPSDYRVLGFVIMLEGRVLLGPSISGTESHPLNLSIEFLSGQAARDAKFGTASVDEMDELAPPSKHDVEELYGIIGPQFIPDLDMTDTDNDGKIDYFDTDDDNDGIWDWEDPEPKTLPAEEESGGGNVPAPGAVAALSILAAVAILISRRDD